MFAYSPQKVLVTLIPPKGAGTLEDAGCVCAVAATGTVPKALLKIIHIFSEVRIACLTITNNLKLLLACKRIENECLCVVCKLQYNSLLPETEPLMSETITSAEQ